MSKPRLTVKEKRAYLKNSGCCPKCLTDDVEGGSYDADGNHIYMRITCLNKKCGFEGLDDYKLSAVWGV